MDKKVVISVGHCYNPYCRRDTGAVAKKYIEGLPQLEENRNKNVYYEGEIVWFMANDIVNYLSKIYNLNAILVYGTLKEKVRKIRKIKPLCGIEVHLNATVKHTQRGHEVLYSVNNKDSKILASYIDKWLDEIKELKDRNIKVGYYRQDYKRKILLYFFRYFLVRGIKIPLAIVEPVFFDNKEDQLILKERWDDIVMNISRGIVDFLQSYKKIKIL